MTTGLTLLVLRFAFLAVLWLFVFVIVFALRSDLFGQRVRAIPTDPKAGPSTPTTPPMPAGAGTAAAASGASPGAFTELIGQASAPTAATAGPVATRLVITEGAREGMEMPLGGGPITIGRSSESNVVIRDDYTSTNHARLDLQGGAWVLTDLGSTNGTFVGGQKVTVPTTVAERTPITIGTTTFELRR